MRGPEGGRISTISPGRISAGPRISAGGPRFSGNFEARALSSVPRLLTGRVGATRMPGLEARIPTVSLNQQRSPNVTINRIPGLGRFEGMSVIPQLRSTTLDQRTMRNLGHFNPTASSIERQNIALLRNNSQNIPQQSRLAGNEIGRTSSARQLPKMGEFTIHPLASLPGNTVGKLSPRELEGLVQQPGSNSRLRDTRDRSVQIVEMPQRQSRQIAPANPEFTVPEITTARPITIRSEVKRIKTELGKIKLKKVSPEPTQPTIDLRLSTEAMQTTAEIKPKTSGAEFNALLRSKVINVLRSRGVIAREASSKKAQTTTNIADTTVREGAEIYPYDVIRKTHASKFVSGISQRINSFDFSVFFEKKKGKKQKRVVDQPEINTRQILRSDIEQNDTLAEIRTQLRERVQSFISQKSAEISPALSENPNQQLRLVRIDQPVLQPESSTNSSLPNPGGGGGGGGGEFRINRRKRQFPRKEITLPKETENAKKLLPVAGYPEFFTEYDKKIDHHPILHFKIDDPVQGRRLDEWSQAVRTAFASSRFVEAVPMNVIVSALPNISKPTESTLITQFNRKRDGSNRDWRRELFTQVKVTMSQAFTTGIEVIRRMPAVIMDLMGVDAKSEDVVRVMNGDNVAESALAA